MLINVIDSLVCIVIVVVVFLVGFVFRIIILICGIIVLCFI